MGIIKNIIFNAEVFKLEEIAESEIKEIAEMFNGNYNSEPGRYFVITTKNNFLTYKELMLTKDTQEYVKNFVGQAGIIIQDIKSPKTGNIIHHGPELIDLYVNPQYRKKGFAQLLTIERLNFLKNNGWNNAYFTQKKIIPEVKKVFDRLEERKYITYSMNNTENSEENHLFEIKIL